MLAKKIFKKMEKRIINGNNTKMSLLYSSLSTLYLRWQQYYYQKKLGIVLVAMGNSSFLF